MHSISNLFRFGRLVIDLGATCLQLSSKDGKEKSAKTPDNKGKSQAGDKEKAPKPSDDKGKSINKETKKK